MKPLKYVFEVKFLSITGNIWIRKHFVTRPNTGPSPTEIAGQLAAQYLSPVEMGVRVRFLGIQKDDGPITSLGFSNFHIVIVRDIPVEQLVTIVADSQVNRHVQGKSEESYERQDDIESLCQKWADELRKPVVLYLKRESGTKTFTPTL